VTRPRDAQPAVEAAFAKFERIDVLVNNAGNFFAGFFEELSPEQQTFKAKANTLLVQAHAHRELSGSLGYDTP